jgi:hypothetical protein
MKNETNFYFFLNRVFYFCNNLTDFFEIWHGGNGKIKLLLCLIKHQSIKEYKTMEEALRPVGFTPGKTATDTH